MRTVKLEEVYELVIRATGNYEFYDTVEYFNSFIKKDRKKAFTIYSDMVDIVYMRSHNFETVFIDNSFDNDTKRVLDKLYLSLLNNILHSIVRPIIVSELPATDSDSVKTKFSKEFYNIVFESIYFAKSEKKDIDAEMICSACFDLFGDIYNQVLNYKKRLMKEERANGRV